MAKTKPIGVRFTQELFDSVKGKGLADTPQKALNLYEQTYASYINGQLKEVKKITERPSGIGNPVADVANSELWEEYIQAQIDKLTAEMNGIKDGHYGTPMRNKILDKITKLKRQL